MGCDIHMNVQYQNKKEAKEAKKQGRDPYWWDYGGGFNPGRNYTMFGILAGVRDYPNDESKGFDPRGIPDFGIGYGARHDLYLYITKEPIPGEGCCTLEQAQRWGRRIVNNDKGEPWYTEHPDWHSHTWLTIKELAQAYRWYKKATGYEPCLEYRVLLKVMKALEDNGENKVVVVFWFDN